MNLPNKLTVIRVLMIPFYIFFQMSISEAFPAAKWIALVLFCAASLTDMFDGMLARKYNLVTNFGKFMDPLADKLLVCSALICFVELKLLPAWFVIIIVAREFIISGFRLIACEQGKVIAAGYWGKLKTVSHMLLIIMLIINLQITGYLVAVEIVKWIALALTLISLGDYMIKNISVISEGGF